MWGRNASRGRRDDKPMIKAQWKGFVEDRAEAAWLPKLNQLAKPILGID